jgi:isopenicillin-N epimerase
MTTSAAELRKLFLLDPSVTFLNHGSFGACPSPVLAAREAWTREMEREPVLFLARRYPELMDAARVRIAEYLKTDKLNLVWVSNATTGVNIVARSLATRLSLGLDDEVLACDHEYGACERTFRYLSGIRGFSYRSVPIRVPVDDPEELADRFWEEVSPKTKVIFLSHITSPTGMRLPIESICARAREAGIVTLIDGAHAPGQIDLDLDALGADFYTGNFHKWLCAPKGAAFLYARPELQGLLEPLVVSWGWEPEIPGPSPFIDQQEFDGTRDITPFLSVPAAIDFHVEHDWPGVRDRCHTILRGAREALLALPGVEALHPDDRAWYVQMEAMMLPPHIDKPMDFHLRLYEEHRVEVPVYTWQDRSVLRVSIQGYNSEEDVEALVEAVDTLLRAG